MNEKDELLASIQDIIRQMQASIAALDEEKINQVPYKDSWTPAQLFRHVTKSVLGMTRAMKMPGKPSGRDSGERIPELKKVFLDFNHKLNAPEFIVPEAGPYQKEKVVQDLSSSFEDFRQAALQANGEELVEGLPLGPITRRELLHFVLYHTQRHQHQLKKMLAALEAAPA